MALGLSDIQVSLEASKELRMECTTTTTTLTGWIWPRVVGKGLCLDSSRLGLGGSHGWECREAFYRRLKSGSVGKDHLHGSIHRSDEKRQSMV